MKKEQLEQAIAFLQAGRGEEALALLEKMEGEEAAFLKVSAYLSLSRLKEASDLFFAHRDAFYSLYPKKTIEVDFELRFLNRDFAGAYADIAHFNDKPYVSQEVEEVLRTLPRLVSANVAALSAETKSASERLKDLHSDDDYVALSALSRLDPNPKDEGVRLAVREIAEREDRSSDLRTYALLFLKAQGDREPLFFRRGDYEASLVPNELPDPMKEEGRLAALAILAEEKDVGAARLAASLIENAIISAYPFPYPGERPREAAAAALRKANVLLGEEDDGPKGEDDRLLEELLSTAGAIR